MSTFGDIERTFADLYEYRWAMLAGILVFTAAIAGLAYWKGVHLWIWQRRLPVAAFSLPALVVMVWLGWSLGSPLFTNKTVEEEFPFSFTAVVPPEMEMEEIESIMAGMAMVTQAVDETMPELVPAAGESMGASSLALEDADRVMLNEGLAAMAEGMKASDDVMMEKGLEMMADAMANIEAEAMEASPTVPAQTPAAVALKVGSFKDADSFHRGKGQATIYRGADGTLLLRLEELDVTNGPDLHVILSPHMDPDNPSQTKTEGYIDLGKLKGNRGNQNYPIPSDVNIGIFGSVVIYCEPFSVVFSVAPLADAT